MVDPSNEFVKQEIEHHTKCRVQALVGTASEVSQAIRRHYKIKGELVDNVSSSDRISKITFQQAMTEKIKDKDENETEDKQ